MNSCSIVYFYFADVFPIILQVLMNLHIYYFFNELRKCGLLPSIKVTNQLFIIFVIISDSYYIREYNNIEGLPDERFPNFDDFTLQLPICRILVFSRMPLQPYYSRGQN